jgi:hypothetical protein
MLGRRFFGSTIRGFDTVEGGGDIDIRALICKALDLERRFTWAEINGVRRVVEIRFSSESVNDILGQDVVLVRTFSYQSTDPFDLVSEIDALVAA